MSYILYSALIFIISIILVRLIIVLAARFSLLDIPNQRSMHQTVTPRGGGLVVVLSVFCVFIIMFSQQKITSQAFYAVMIPLMMTAIIAFIDDYRSLSIKLRASIYAISALVFLYLIPMPYPIWFSGLLLIAFVWIINLYNFMDGIDGLAAIEAMSVSLFAILLFYSHQNDFLLWFGITIFCSSAGFLIWNWSPAKIFMGDVGSCSLGLLFSMIALLSNIQLSTPFAVWLILLAIFICDTTYTFLWRCYKGEKWYQAHKTHAYQCLVEKGYSHKKVCIAVLITNLCLLWPAAFLAYQNPARAWLINVIIYTVFLYTWYRMKRHSALDE